MFFEVTPPVLGDDQQLGDLVPVDDLAAIEPDVGNVGLGVFGNDGAESVDKAPTVLGLPARDREIIEVDPIVGQDILLDRAALDQLRGKGFPGSLPDETDDLGGLGFPGQPQGHRQPLARGHPAGEQAGAPGLAITFNVLEEQGRPSGGEVDSGDGADLAVPINFGPDMGHLVVGFEPADPFPKILRRGSVGDGFH